LSRREQYAFCYRDFSKASDTIFHGVLTKRLVPRAMADSSTEAGAGQVGTQDSVIFSGSLTKLRIVPHSYPEDLTQSSIIKYFSNNLDDERRKHTPYIFRS